MARTVTVELAERSYDIRIGSGLPASQMAATVPAPHVLIVTDRNVDTLYGDRTEAALRKAGATISRAVVPAGEETKSEGWVFKLYEKAVAAGLDRTALIAALGGGVVGDLAGFVAATYLRGIRYVQIPTTLLAMVDSSVGGKTGINLPAGKNLVGAFHQPSEVLVDLDTLRTLSRREYVCGLAEVVKYGVIADAALFSTLESNTEALLARDPALLTDIVARCCEVKAEVVSKDEREGGLRAILNFGHTLAHALENQLGYGRLLHGEAVAVGMVFAARVSVAQCGFPADEAGRVSRLLEALGLPASVRTLPDLGASAEGLAWRPLRQAMTTDKKVRGATPRFVLAERLGTVVFGRQVPEDVLAAEWVKMGG